MRSGVEFPPDRNRRNGSAASLPYVGCCSVEAIEGNFAHPAGHPSNLAYIASTNLPRPSLCALQLRLLLRGRRKSHSHSSVHIRPPAAAERVRREVWFEETADSCRTTSPTTRVRQVAHYWARRRKSRRRWNACSGRKRTR